VPTDGITDLARRYRVDVNMGTFASPDWQQLYGIEKIKPVFTPTRKSDDTVDDAGADRLLVTGYKWGLELDLKHRTASDGVTWNAVQEKLRAASEATSTTAAEVQIRYYDRSGRSGDNASGWVTVDWDPKGGGNQDDDLVTVKLNGQGPKTALTNPLADLTPIVSALSPATGPTAGGTLVAITGTNFTGVTGATGVKFGTNNATSYVVLDSTRIVAVAPAGTAGSKDVTVTNSTGTSATTGTGNDYLYT
jgi:hypothetical protein